jgi:hypothetical protein
MWICHSSRCTWIHFFIHFIEKHFCYSPPNLWSPWEGSKAQRNELKIHTELIKIAQKKFYSLMNCPNGYIPVFTNGSCIDGRTFSSEQSSKISMHHFLLQNFSHHPFLRVLESIRYFVIYSDSLSRLESIEQL